MRYIIVGGTSGIGLAAARMAVEAGHAVLAAGRETAKFAEAEAVGATTAQIDASDSESVQRFFAKHGEFDHLVLSVSGSSGAGSFRELDINELRKGFEGKFWPQVSCAKAALATLRPGGSITFVGAISARALKPGTAGLAAINAALEAMVPILASSCAPRASTPSSPASSTRPGGRAFLKLQRPNCSRNWPAKWRSAGLANPKTWQAPSCSSPRTPL